MYLADRWYICSSRDKTILQLYNLYCTHAVKSISSISSFTPYRPFLRERPRAHPHLGFGRTNHHMTIMAAYLQPMLVTNVHLVGTDCLSEGTFGTIRECAIDETRRCAGKTFRQTGWSSDDERVKFEARYAFVCRLMSRLDHDNVVKFLGVTLLPGDNELLPTMLMELMTTDLHCYLEETPSIPFLQKLSFLSGIGQGLAYLHGLSIVHGDLTAKNVLLSCDLMTKITDFDSAWVLERQRANHKGSPMIAPPKQHGAEAYMPPEANPGQYAPDCSFDVFSFGHLALFVLLQVSVTS